MLLYITKMRFVSYKLHKLVNEWMLNTSKSPVNVLPNMRVVKYSKSSAKCRALKSTWMHV